MLPLSTTGALTRHRALAALVAVAALLLTGVPALSGSAWAAGTRYVSPTGSDANPGSATAPYRTLAKGLTSVQPGETLVVRGGTYAERIMSPSIKAATASARTKVVAAPGERPVVEGLLWLSGASYWDISGINVTWSSRNSGNEHMVKLTGGTGWTFTDAEVWGARSYAAILVAGSASQWTVARNYVHDTAATNGTNQDHLIYANSGTGGGTIERNVLVGSPNGRAVKVGPPAATSGIVENIVIRYNTMVDNLGPSNVQLAWGTSRVSTYRNLMVKPGSNRSAVTAYQLTGTGNVVSDNAYWNAVRALDTGVSGMRDGGGNVLVDPKFANPSAGDYRPTNAAAAGYGRYAGQTAEAPATTTAPAPAPTTAPTTEPAPTTTTAPAPAPAPTTQPAPTTTTAPAPTPTTTTAPAPTTTTAPAPAPSTGGIVFRGASAGANGTASTLVLSRPSGTLAGDVLLASVDVRGRPAISAPAGWRLLSTTDNGTTVRKATFYRTATSSDPASWTWTLSKAAGASGTVVAHGGVSTTSPVQATAVQANGWSKTVTAPSTSGAPGVVVAFFGTSRETALTAPSGVVERAEARTSAGQYRVTSMAGTFSLASTGTTGSRAATALHDGTSLGQLVLLRAAG